jgi:23S rRNA pseudouridine1911/1915/1917 synthase
MMKNEKRAAPITEGGTPAILEPSRILYLSDECAVVNKLSGEAVEGAGQGMGDLPRMLAAVLPDMEARALPTRSLPAAAHRLDVPVTGCVVFARSSRALSFLNRVFSGEQDRRLEKHYWAVVEMPEHEKEILREAELVHWLDFDPKKNKSAALDESGPGLKKAVLRCRLIGHGERYLFYDVNLVTGRHHQIRAQFAKMGLHIKGDLKYGSKRSEKNGGIRLHAYSLCFPDPAGGADRIEVKAPPPVEDNLWKAFEEAFTISGAGSGEN